jgi:dTDP-4-dehydrorhamnose 3,5-epimerase
MSNDTDLLAAKLPDGVVVRPLTVHADPRGTLTEIYRQEWRDCEAVQFNCVSSVPNVLRGVHAHMEHTDHLVVLAGGMLLGLHDLRPWSSDFGHSCMRRLDGAAPVAVVLPPGVAHGFYFEKPAVMIYGISTYWDMADEIGCNWDAPELGFRWPTKNPVLSPRDSNPGGYAQMADQFVTRWNKLHGRVTA